MSDKLGMRAVYTIALTGIFCFLGGTGRVARGQGAGGTRAQETLPGSRTLKTFDFEETTLGNFEPTPMYWSKVIGKGFPAYSAGAFDHKQFRSSNTSFMLKTDGGSVAYRFTPPAEKRIAVHPNADYYVIAFVRTSQLKHARASVTAWFADEAGELLLPTETHSQPYTGGAVGADDAWQVLYVYLPGPTAEADGTVKAKSLVLQLGLIQPQQLGADAGLGKFALYQQDVQGAVWFDDVAVFQLPRVNIQPRHEAKSLVPPRMFGPGEPVVLDVELSDLTGGGRGSLKTRVRLTDPDGLVMGEETWTMDATATQGWSRKFEHAPLPAGMYTATLEVIDQGGGEHGGLIARRQTQFLCLPESPRSVDGAAEFGLGATSYNDATAWGQLPLLLRQTGAGTLQIPAWRHDMPEEALTRRDTALENLLVALQRQNARVIGAFTEMPRLVAARLSPGSREERISIQALLNADAALWRPYVTFLMTRYANRCDWWELGSPEEPFSGMLGANGALPDTTAADRSMALYKKTYGEIGAMLARQELVIPWNALFDFDAQRYPHAVLDLQLPAVIKPSQIPAYIENFRQAASGATAATASGAPAGKNVRRAPIFVHLEGLPPRESSRDDRLADFAQRVVFAFTSAPESMLLDVDENHPDELLLVYGTMIRALGGATFEGELPLTAAGQNSVRAFLFRKISGTASLVLWTDAAGKQVSLDLPLGKAPRTGDLLGNPRTLKTDAATQLTHLTVSSVPLVVENVEPQMLQLTSSFALSTPLLPAGAGSARTEVLLKNPYPEPLTGSLRLLPPAGWAVDPPSLTVAIPAGETMRQEITLRYPFTETAGTKKLQGRLLLDPGNAAGLAGINVTFPAAISSQTVEMEGFTQVDANGDILLQQVITNTTDEALDAQSYALVPGYPQQHRYIVGLQPHQTTIKRYTFSAKDYVEEKGAGGAPKSLLGTPVTMGLRQNDGRTLLTKSVPVE